MVRVGKRAGEAGHLGWKIAVTSLVLPAVARARRRSTSLTAAGMAGLASISARARFSAAFAVDGDNMVEGVRFADGRVYVNAAQYFDNVPEDVFDFRIGGYQPAQKWLKDRKGRALTNADCDHYQSIVLALVKTRDVMAALSRLSPRWL